MNTQLKLEYVVLVDGLETFTVRAFDADGAIARAKFLCWELLYGLPFEVQELCTEAC